jgi:hypothetical protein
MKMARLMCDGMNYDRNYSASLRPMEEREYIQKIIAAQTVSSHLLK